MPRQGFIGLDGAKDTFTAAFLIVDALSDQILHEQIATFSDDHPGWQRFLATWEPLHANFWWIGLEASGPYSALLEAHLLRLHRPNVSLHRPSCAPRKPKGLEAPLQPPGLTPMVGRSRPGQVTPPRPGGPPS
jgi:hypothetical protein